VRERVPGQKRDGGMGERGTSAREREGPAQERERDQRVRDRDWHATVKDWQAADGAMRERTSAGERDQQA
jgi:hypothetical protein